MKGNLPRTYDAAIECILELREKLVELKWKNYQLMNERDDLLARLKKYEDKT